MTIPRKLKDYILEIGCGVTQVPDADVAIDKFPFPNVDIVRDVAKRGVPFSTNTFDAVISFDVIEHIERYDDLIFLINEIWRVLKVGGIWYFTTPNGSGGLQYLTHHRTFFPNSFDYFRYNHVDDPTWDGMRKSDNIEALFELNFDTDLPTVIQGKFVKRDREKTFTREGQ